MSVHRYDVLDAYTLEELRREYTRADAKGRVSLLKKLYEQKQGNPIPFEIARMAVGDGQVEVREWIALHGRFLDYSKTHYEGGNHIIEFPERNLEEHLKNDPEPFVRACLRENLTAFSGTGDFYWMPYFQEATHLERLALMRNPEARWGDELIKRIFDHENLELGISLDERKEMIAAFLTNKEALAHLRQEGERETGVEKWYGIGETQYFLTTLWDLASKWPKSPESEVMQRVTPMKPVLMPHVVYRYVPASDETKAKIYQAEEDRICRRWILENCTAADNQTLALAMKDKDKHCREIASKAKREKRLTELDQMRQEIANEKNQLQRKQLQSDVITFSIILGLAMVVVKLYFPDWSDLAVIIGLGCLGALAALAVLNRFAPQIMKWLERRKSVEHIFEVLREDALGKARTLLEEGKSLEEVSAETGLTRQVLRREGLVN